MTWRFIRKWTNSNIRRAVTDGPFSAKICQGCMFDPKKEIPYWVPRSHWRQSPVTWKRLPSLTLENYLRETNARELPEVTATAGGCGNCWQLRRVAFKARNMMENALSLLIIFPHNSNKLRPETESCVFSGLGVRAFSQTLTRWNRPKARIK